MSGLCSRNRKRFLAPIVALMAFLSLTPGVFAGESATLSPPINAFYLSTIPADYAVIATFFRALKNGGANTIMLRPSLDQGRINKNVLTNQVYLAHQAGLSFFVILPTRSMKAALAEHPEWEDFRFDTERGDLQPAGKLDLFNPRVIVYLSDFFKDIAGYSVDGILLDEDFFYSEVEGMSEAALERYKKKYGSSFNPWKEIPKLTDAEMHEIQQYGEGFWNLAGMKSERLMLLLKNILQSSHAVNKKVKIGIPLHVPGFSQAKEQLAWFSYDMNALKTMNIDLYWVAFSQRDIREQRNIGYRKSMEVLSRMVKSVINMRINPANMVIAVKTTSTTGAVLPSSEIEEALEMVKHAGEPGLAFIVNADTMVPAVLTNKMFRRQ